MDPERSYKDPCHGSWNEWNPSFPVERQYFAAKTQQDCSICPFRQPSVTTGLNLPSHLMSPVKRGGSYPSDPSTILLPGGFAGSNLNFKPDVSGNLPSYFGHYGQRDKPFSRSTIRHKAPPLRLFKWSSFMILPVIWTDKLWCLDHGDTARYAVTAI